MTRNNHVAYHLPVLLRETLELLVTKKSGTYVDCTAGGGGHTAAIMDCLVPPGMVVGIDRDGDAVQEAKGKVGSLNSMILHGSFGSIEKIIQQNSVQDIFGFLFDLGVSSHQFDSAERGFSYRFDGPLDMRMNNRTGASAAALLEKISKEDLAEALRIYGDVRGAGRIAARIAGRKIETTEALKDAVSSALKGEASYGLLSKVFMAIRILVNNEFEELRNGLDQAFGRLEKNGRIAVISYHSGEDRIVKNWIRSKSRACACPPHVPVCVCGGCPAAKRIGPAGGIVPAENEIEKNPRARSARLRVIEKI